MKYFKEEQHFAKLSERNVRQKWEADGSKGIHEVANERARSILKNHKPNHLSNKTIAELEREVSAIYKREGEKYKPFSLNK